ncbi:hypothetical protein OE88DRAFT_1656023 [Heliocybe sulcata]|uniref:Fungal pheromone STE3G-protein-coupled receptor n=1 Tax=Heliocybe sulcata TaxID=5364 RepID=A0A5C3N937_9AGAM|nr:hypothetical protein OE88DRAFT_1656023 [Heliocybe sulcata]
MVQYTPARSSSSVLYQRSSDLTLQSNDLALVRLFMALQLGAGLALIISTATMCISFRVKRHPTWISFCVSWIISCLSYTLLLISGYETTPDPPFSLCLCQSVLIYGVPVLTSFATLALVVHLHFSMSALLHEDQESRTIHVSWLLLCPYVLFAIVIVEALELGLAQPELIIRGIFYCRSDAGTQGKVSSLLVALAAVVGMPCEIYTAVMVYRQWPKFRYAENPQKSSLAFLLRVACFTVAAVVAFCVSMLFTSKSTISSHPESVAGNILLALVPVAAFLTAGIGMDIVRSWMFWRWSSPVTFSS